VPLPQVKDVAEYLEQNPPTDGAYLPLPPRAPSGLLAVMRACWALDPQRRPDFHAIIAMLDETHNEVVRQQGLLSSNSFARMLMNA
jgi:hypothetical protein